ncbi:MAG: asparagine--tRNA ligase [Mycoplasma sp.]
MKKTTNNILWKQFKDLDSQEVTIQGWAKSNRDNGHFGFISFTDGTNFNPIQIVYKSEIITNYEEVKAITTGSAIEITGTITNTPEAKQPFEIQAKEIKVLALCDSEYPLQKKRHSNEFLREIAHLRPRTNLFSAVMKIRSELYMILNNYFRTNDFVWLASPELTKTDAEGNGEAFKLEMIEGKHFFGTDASLSGTGQLHAEAYAMAFKNIYTFGPQFRAEKSHTNRHASEFWMLEPEVAFFDVNDIMGLIEDMLKKTISEYMISCKTEIEFLNQFVEPTLLSRLDSIMKNDFIKISYTDVIDILIDVVKKGHKFTNNNIHWGMDLESEHERYICEVHYNGPVFVFNYPIELKAFYMKQNDDGKTVAGVDLLVPGVGELCGGSEREASYDNLINRANALNMPIEGIQWYLDLRKYGFYKSSGFGLGFERLIMYVTGINNIRDAIPFPRTHGSIKF